MKTPFLTVIFLANWFVTSWTNFALVAAGKGGKDHVSAACIEIRDQDPTVVVRCKE